MGTRVKEKTSAKTKLRCITIYKPDLPKDSDGTDVHLGIAVPFTAPQRRYTLRAVSCIATCSFCAAQLD